MRLRVFSVPERTPLWRILLALVLVFLPFSAFAAGMITLTRLLLDPAGASVAEYLHLVGALVSAGVVHELGHWAAAGPGVRIAALTATPGMATVRVRLAPPPPLRSARWVCSTLGGAAANLLAAGLLLLLWRHDAYRVVAYIGLHLLTAILNLIPFRTGATGPSDGWILLQGLRSRAQET